MLASAGSSQSKKVESQHYKSTSEKLASEGGAAQDPMGQSHMKSMGEGIEGGTIDPDDTPTDSDMDEMIRASTLDKKTKKVTHRVTKDWNSKISVKLTSDAEDARAASHAGKR